jgi:hypothetical protein
VEWHQIRGTSHLWKREPISDRIGTVLIRVGVVDDDSSTMKVCRADATAAIYEGRCSGGSPRSVKHNGLSVNDARVGMPLVKLPPDCNPLSTQLRLNHRRRVSITAGGDRCRSIISGSRRMFRRRRRVSIPSVFLGLLVARVDVRSGVGLERVAVEAQSFVRPRGSTALCCTARWAQRKSRRDLARPHFEELPTQMQARSAFVPRRVMVNCPWWWWQPQSHHRGANLAAPRGSRTTAAATISALTTTTTSVSTAATTSAITTTTTTSVSTVATVVVVV